MTDFTSILRQSLKQRGPTSADERERIYSHARALMIRKLWSMQPALSSNEIDDHIRRFNAAVDQVEHEHSGAAPRHDRVGDDGRPARRQQAAPGGARANGAPPAPAPRQRKPMPAEVASPRAPQRGREAELHPAVAERGGRAAPAGQPRPRDPYDKELAARAPKPRRRGNPAPTLDEPPEIGGHDRWREPQLRGNDRYADPEFRGRGSRRYADDDFDDLAGDAPRRKPRRRRSMFGRLFAIGVTGLTAAVVLWCAYVFYPLLVPVDRSAEGTGADNATTMAQLRPVPPARQVLAPPGEAGPIQSPGRRITAEGGEPPAAAPGQAIAAPVGEPTDPRATINTQSLETFIVFDGRDPTVFDAVSDNPIQFNGDIQGGFARITSTTGSAGVRAIVGPGLAQKLAGRRVKVIVVARSSLLGGAGSIRVAYESGSTLSPWKTIRISPDYAPIELIWDIPANRNARANDYVLIEPGLPGDGSSADIRWIRIETLPS